MNSTKPKVLFLSTYPPRECGIATFTQDIVREIKKGQRITPKIVAIDDDVYQYGDDVLLQLAQEKREAYAAVAEEINQSGADLLVVEHEYGIYGGVAGEYLLDLMERVEIPIMLTCHTVLPNPDDDQRRVLSNICQLVDRVTVMSNLSRRMLVEIYDVEPQKIIMIHHGVPVIKTGSRDELKREKGLQKRTVVSTFGLLSQGKGIEYAIKAIAQVAPLHPEILYLILGQTHPVVKRMEGEVYRENLQKLVVSLGIEDNVRFVNRYLDKNEILQYLMMSDVYMTPYLGKDQAVSGTLAYAVGCGRVIVSTPYLYAREMLAEGRGLLAEFGNAESLGDCLTAVISDPRKKRQMEENTLALGKTMSWPQIEKQYEEAFEQLTYSNRERKMAL